MWFQELHKFFVVSTNLLLNRCCVLALPPDYITLNLCGKDRSQGRSQPYIVRRVKHPMFSFPQFSLFSLLISPHFLADVVCSRVSLPRLPLPPLPLTTPLTVSHILCG